MSGGMLRLIPPNVRTTSPGRPSGGRIYVEDAGLALVVYAIAVAIGLCIQYLIIRAAVKSGAIAAARELGVAQPSLSSSASTPTVPASPSQPAVGQPVESPPALGDDELMAKYKIHRDGDRFVYREYGYERLQDAVNYARRQLGE